MDTRFAGDWPVFRMRHMRTQKGAEIPFQLAVIGSELAAFAPEFQACNRYFFDAPAPDMRRELAFLVLAA